LSQYIEMVDLEDDQEEMTSQDDYETESNHSMDIDDEEGSMADETITAQEQVAPSVDMAEQAGV
jgi:hypothetical protein